MITLHGDVNSLLFQYMMKYHKLHVVHDLGETGRISSKNKMYCYKNMVNEIGLTSKYAVVINGYQGYNTTVQGVAGAYDKCEEDIRVIPRTIKSTIWIHYQVI